MTKYDKWVEEDDFKCTKFENFIFMAYHISDGHDKSKLREGFPQLFVQEQIEPIVTTTEYIRKHGNFKEPKRN